MSWLRRAADGSITLTLHVQTGAARTEFAGLHGEAIKLRLAAPPVDGKANACLKAFLADYFKASKRAVTFVGGETSRHKIVRVMQPDGVMLQRLLSALKIELKD